MLPKAILLDLDDTLIAYDYGIDLHKCWSDACEKHLSDNHTHHLDQLITSIRAHEHLFWSDAINHKVGRLNLAQATTQFVFTALQGCNLQDPEFSLSTNISTDFQKERDEATYLYPGALEALIFFKKKGVKLALITNGASKTQRDKISRFNLEKYFDHILIEEEFGTGKPDPSVFNHVIQALDVQAKETWMIGDNFEWEIIPPLKLGIQSVWINPMRKLAPYQANADFITVGTLSDITTILQSYDKPILDSF